MIKRIVAAILLATLFPVFLSADEKPYITTKTPLTLLSANDGESDILWRKTLRRASSITT